MKIALLTTDSREHYKNYTSETPTFGTAPRALLDGFARVPDVEVHVLSCFQQMPISSPDKLVANIWYHGLHVPKIGWLRTGYQGCIRAVRKKLRDIRPDIVHGQGTERDCALSAVFSGFPNVLTIHGNMRSIAAKFPPKLFDPLWFTSRLEAFTIPRTAGVICISSHTENAVAGLAARTWLVPNAVDWTYFGLIRTRPSVPKLICVANIYPLKNQVALIDVLVPLADRLPFELHFFGTLSRESDYGRAFVDRLERYPWVRYGGFLEKDLLTSHFRDASIFILPTREDNCPMAILEAMTAGIPVVASAVGGIPDLIDNGRTGLLTNPDKPETMRAAVERLLAEPEFARELAGNALRGAERRFHPRVIAEKHLEIYREVLSTG